MIYPKFIEKESCLGLPAPSGATKLEDEEKYFKAAKKLEKLGFKLKHSKNNFTIQNFVSAPAKERAEEFVEMWQDESLDALVSIAGGEFMMEILPYLDEEKLKEANAKWFMGFSDNTVLNHVLLTWLDTASIYHYTFKHFAMKKWHKSFEYSYNLLNGKQLEFEGFKKYQAVRAENPKPGDGFVLKDKVKWINARGEKELSFSGRAIGGCLDVLLLFLGTPYDKTAKFVSEYAEDGFIWYLESFDLKVTDMKRALWQLKQAGWFENVKGFVFGRPKTNEPYGDFTYQKAVMSVLEEINVPVVFDADIGHIFPIIPIVNGAIMNVESKKGRGIISFKFE